jgi:tetratricopeptide (TPR) repeat protein
MIKETHVRSRQHFPGSRLLLRMRAGSGLTVIGFLLLCGLFLYPAACMATATPSELLDAGRVDEALRLLVPQASGNNAATFNYLCRAYFAIEDWDNAVRYCERAAQIDPGNAVFQLWLGRSYGEKANSAGPLSAYSFARKTVAAFITARTLDRQSVAIARDLAEYFSAAPSVVGGGSDKALSLAAEIAPSHPSDAAWIRAMVAAHEGDNERAEREYNDSIRLDHYSASTYIEFARHLRGRKLWGRFQQTVELATKTARIRPVDRYDAADLLLSTNRDLNGAAQQMRAYIQSGGYEEAAPLFRAHFLLGEILLKSGDTNQAANEYRAALALASSYRPAAEALRRLGQR